MKTKAEIIRNIRSKAMAARMLRLLPGEEVDEKTLLPHIDVYTTVNIKEY